MVYSGLLLHFHSPISRFFFFSDCFLIIHHILFISETEDSLPRFIQVQLFDLYVFFHLRRLNHFPDGVSDGFDIPLTDFIHLLISPLDQLSKSRMLSLLQHLHFRIDCIILLQFVKQFHYGVDLEHLLQVCLCKIPAFLFGLSLSGKVWLMRFISCLRLICFIVDE